MNSARLDFPKFRFYADLPQLKGWEKAFQDRGKKRYPAKTVIVEQGQRVTNLFYIVSGLVEYTYTHEDGSQEMLEILGDGNLFGLQPIFGDNPAVGSFIALEDCVLSLIPAAELKELLRMQPELAQETLTELAKIIGGLIRQLHSQTYRADYRVEEVLCMLAEYKIHRGEDENNLFVTLSQDDLARISRTTRVTVTKVCGELKKQGIVETSYGGIIIKDMAGLRNMLDH